MATIEGSLEDLAKDLGNRIVSSVKTTYGKNWDTVKDEIKTVLSAVAVDAGRLAVRKIKGEDISQEQKHIDAQLASLKAAGEVLAARTFWQSFDRVMAVIGTSLGTIAKAGLKALLA